MSGGGASGDPALADLKMRVIARTGHAYYHDKDRLLLDRIHERMRAVDAATPEAYAARLDADPGEWRALESAITINETYFFRHPEQFERLRRNVLPRLIAQRSATKALRIWSVGCSTGAEPYSVAILLRDMLGESIGDWRITLVGGDISEAALERARTGRFGAWALRTMVESERQRLFDREEGMWRLKGVYRAMVRFERQNLLDLTAPARPMSWAGFDLILCRNVLIYFDLAEASRLACALRDALAPDGELMLGPVEAAITSAPALEAADFAWTPQPDAPVAGVAAGVWTPLIPDFPPSPAIRFEDRAPQPANDSSSAVDPGGRIDEVRRLADAGAYEDAHALCQRLIADTPVSARLQYYDAILRQVSEDRIGAEAALRRAIYLDRSFALAHHRLGALMLTAGRTDEARRALMSAARLAEAAPADAEIAEGQGLTAGDFARQVREQLGALGAAR